MILSWDDPYGLIWQMYPSFWGPEKRREIAQMPRLRQIQEIVKYRKEHEQQYEQVDQEVLIEAVKHILQGSSYGVEKAGELWYRVKAGKHVFYTDQNGLDQFSLALRERMAGGL
jgi:hypothetical protein